MARRPVAWVVVGAVAVGAVTALTVTQPWRLFVDERVDEGPPVAAGTGDGSPGAATTDAPVVRSRAQLVAKAHPARGTALVLELADGSRYVRLEDLVTDNGPDLRVYLSTAAPEASDDEVDADVSVVDLGALKGNLGNQNYEVPAGVDLSQYRSVVIWCERFTVAFGAAPVSSTDARPA
jgi:hypothetical protein